MRLRVIGYPYNVNKIPDDPYVSGISEGPSATDYELRLSILELFPEESKTFKSRSAFRFNPHLYGPDAEEKDRDELAKMVNMLQLAGIEVDQYSYWMPSGNSSPGGVVFVAEIVVNSTAIAAFFAALASAFKTYMNRRSTRKVAIYDEKGRPILKVNGDFTTQEIEALLRTRLLSRLQGEDETTNELPNQASRPSDT
jgi:hypothetical protein